MSLPGTSLEPRVAAVLWRHRRAIVLAAGLLWVTVLSGVALLGVSGAFLTGTALTFGVAAGFNYFVPSAGIRALTLARILSRYGEKVVGHQATLRIARDLRVWFFARVVRLTPMQLGRLRNGDLMARLLDDIDQVDGLLVRALAPLLALSGTGALAIAAAAWLYPPAAACLAGMALVIGVVVPWRVAVGQRAVEGAHAESRAELSARLHETYQGATDLAAVRAESDWLRHVANAADTLAAADVARRQRLVSGESLHQLAGAAGLVAMLWLVGDGVVTGGLTPAAAAGLFFLTFGTLEAWAGAGLAWQAWIAARVAASRIDGIAAQRPAVADPERPRAVPALGALRFEDVHFAWRPGSREVLEGLDLVLRPGERIALRGDSGVGKSTLLALLLRSVDPMRGSVRYGGVDLRELAQEEWHARIAWLPQNAPILAGTLRDTLCLGSEVEDARLWEMLARMRLDDWARAAGGLDRWLGEAGATVSAGQARRLALARALLRPGPLVVLDEPTEGLDHDTAQAVMAGLPSWLEGRSLLLISHGELPAGVVDRVYRLEGGRVS
ncbi:thiol reductant ABC exporter subunit CydC [Pseudorhodoferax sp.]|uniref:thiol reductant ABC exporter subunit CydC n=1 Tax=Pseudorhodoferax sp. TaxID=1993553 RepID=UPI002DD6290B|nr:thiol reductant ABC exporter subunit CydC [Pseudorhodoferax sp.]